jgi:hypothetical protein
MLRQADHFGRGDAARRRWQSRPATDLEGAFVMKHLIAAALLAAPTFAALAADVNVNVGSGRTQAAVTLTFGSRDHRGYYWDGYQYRDPTYWKNHNGNKGQKYYTGHGKGNGGCPPGQAKKGNC